MTDYGAGHRYTNSSSSAYSVEEFQYHHRRGESNFSNQADYYNDDQRMDGPPTDCQRCDRCCACMSSTCGRAAICGRVGALWAVASFIFWAVLWGFASSFPMEHQFLLAVGETWAITMPPLWSRSSFGIHALTSDPGVEVYEFSPVFQGKNAKCPAPTSDAMKKLHDVNSVSLQGAQYQYDYYHLNEGSKISLDILQRKGSANIYLLQGYSTLKKLQDKNSAQDFRAKSIVKRYSGDGGETTITYDVTQDDFYIFVYDNAAPLPAQSKLVVQIDIDITTHLLPAAKRVCEANTTASGGCVWTLTSEMDRHRVESSCIIVKAVSTSMDENASPEISTSASQVVVVQMRANVGSISLVCLAGIPLLVGIFLFCREYGSDCIRRKREFAEGESEENGDWHDKYQGYPPKNYQSVSTHDGHDYQSGNMDHSCVPALSETTSNTASSSPTPEAQTGSYQNSGV